MKLAPTKYCTTSVCVCRTGGVRMSYRGRKVVPASRGRVVGSLRGIPSWLYGREDVLAADKLVVGVIWSYQKGEEGRCLLTQRQIGKLCGMTREAVNLAIARLSCTDRGRGRRKVETAMYRRPLVEKLDRWLSTGVVQPCYRVPVHRDSAVWWMMEEEEGRSGIGDLRTRNHAMSEKRRKESEENLLAFPRKRRARGSV